MIRKFALEQSLVFESVELSFKKGFCVFSGPSGSGKSALIESLLACFGLREPNALTIETDLILDKPFLEDFGLEGADLNIKIVKKDKARYFVNFTPIAKKRLSEVLGEYVKHIHSRGGEELESEFILQTLDSLIAQKIPQYRDMLNELESSYKAFVELDGRIKELASQESQIQNLKEMAEFEIAKITSVNPKVGEHQKLLDLKKLLSKKEKIQESINKANQAFEVANDIVLALGQIQSTDCQTLQETLSEALNDAQARLEEENLKLGELDELDSEEILNRLSLLSDLIHRYGSIEGALTKLEEQQKKLQELENFSTNKNALLQQLDSLYQNLHTCAKAIDKQRETHLAEFESMLKELCLALKLNTPSITLQETQMSKSGDTTCQITLKNSHISTLSAGEFNRLRLAMMCIASRISKKQGVLILDEIDANLSGEESEGVAKILKELSHSYQIFAISHQPHMPALATQHFLVNRANGKSYVTLLDKEGRILELARMISGATITQEAIDFAKKRLSENAQNS